VEIDAILLENDLPLAAEPEWPPSNFLSKMPVRSRAAYVLGLRAYSGEWGRETLQSFMLAILDSALRGRNELCGRSLRFVANLRSFRS